MLPLSTTTMRRAHASLSSVRAILGSLIKCDEERRNGFDQSGAFHEINDNGRDAGRQLNGQARASSYRRARQLAGRTDHGRIDCELSCRLRRPPRPAQIANGDRGSLDGEEKHGGRICYERDKFEADQDRRRGREPPKSKIPSGFSAATTGSIFARK